MRKIIKPAAVAGSLLTVMLAVPATAALAASAPHPRPHNVCHAWVQELHTWPLEPRYRVAAECSSINPADKARGVLDLIGLPDGYTDWFTQTGVVYHSHWFTPVLGVRGARTEYAPR